MVAYEDATLAKYIEVRGDRDAHYFRTVMARPEMRVLVQIAFEAGRDWQSKHPTARIDVPDYTAPLIAK